MKKVAQLDENGFFVGMVEADESPLERGVYLIPSRCIDAHPPAVREGYTYQWTGAGFLESAPVAAEDQEPPTPPTPEQLQALVVSKAQERLDAFARSRGYDNILSLCTYVTDPIPSYAAEGQAGIDARSATWAALRGILAEVVAGKRPLPMDWDALESELPKLVWPGDDTESL